MQQTMTSSEAILELPMATGLSWQGRRTTMPLMNIKYGCEHKHIIVKVHGEKFIESLKTVCSQCSCDENNNKILCGNHCNNHSKDTIYQKGACRDCLEEFIVITEKENCDGVYDSSERSKKIVLSKCEHPTIAFDVMEETFENKDNSGLSTEIWLYAKANCKLCDAKNLCVKNKCTGVMENGYQKQVWSGFILNSI